MVRNPNCDNMETDNNSLMYLITLVADTFSRWWTVGKIIKWEHENKTVECYGDVDLNNKFSKVFS